MLDSKSCRKTQVCCSFTHFSRKEDEEDEEETEAEDKEAKEEEAEEACPPPPQPWVPPACATPAEVIERVRAALASHAGVVVCAEAKKASGGWNVTAYVQGELYQAYRETLLATAKQALLSATRQIPAEGSADDAELASGGVCCLLGHAAGPFAQMTLGFGCAVADLPRGACRSAFAKGFCDKPGSCRGQHPKAQVGINVMLKRARR